MEVGDFSKVFLSFIMIACPLCSRFYAYVVRMLLLPHFTLTRGPRPRTPRSAPRERDP